MTTIKDSFQPDRLTTLITAPIFGPDDLIYNNFGSLEKAFDRSINRLLQAQIPIDIHEYDNEYKIFADAPGYNPDEIIIEEHQNVLTIKASKENKIDENDKQGNVVKRERGYKSFVRTFTLPDNANPSNILASLNKGILEITLPKKTINISDEKRRILIN